MGAVIQQTRTDCAVAAAAMLYGIGYDEARERMQYEDSDEGLFEYDVLYLGVALGHFPTLIFSVDGLLVDMAASHPWAKRQQERGAASCSSDDLWRLIEGRPAAVAVPSLNHEDGAHYVFWDGSAIRDPNRDDMKRYEGSARPELWSVVVLG